MHQMFLTTFWGPCKLVIGEMFICLLNELYLQGIIQTVYYFWRTCKLLVDRRLHHIYYYIVEVLDCPSLGIVLQYNTTQPDLKQLWSLMRHEDDEDLGGWSWGLLNLLHWSTCFKFMVYSPVCCSHRIVLIMTSPGDSPFPEIIIVSVLEEILCKLAQTDSRIVDWQTVAWKNIPCECFYQCTTVGNIVLY